MWARHKGQTYDIFSEKIRAPREVIAQLPSVPGIQGMKALETRAAKAQRHDARANMRAGISGTAATTAARGEGSSSSLPPALVPGAVTQQL
jgi:hypothetical protein